MSARAILEPTSQSATPHPSRNIRKTVLPNGLTVLTESMPHMRSVCDGCVDQFGLAR